MIDAHCHLSDPRLFGQIAGVVARSRAAGVAGWILGGVEPSDWDRQTEVRARVGNAVREAYGLHPWWVASASDEALDAALDDLSARLPAASALGELGLDKMPAHANAPESLARQERAFLVQLEIANASAKPLVLHVVRAHGEVISALRRSGHRHRGIVHSFSGGVAEARAYIELGLVISLSGSLVGSQRKMRALAEIPVDRFVFETDAPGKPPPGSNNANSEPNDLPLIAAAWAPMWGETADVLLARARGTLETLFGDCR